MDTIVVCMNIHFLRDFFKHIEEAVSRDRDELESKCESGEIKEYEDYESLIDYAVYRAEFGAKTIYYELNAMVESQLYDKATPRFLIEKNENGKHKRKSSVSELVFFDLLRIIESEYGNLEKEIKNWEEYVRLRKSVNSFKHNQGVRKRQDIEQNKETEGIEWKWVATLEQAEKYLNVIPNIINEIRYLGTGKTPNHKVKPAHKDERFI